MIHSAKPLITSGILILLAAAAVMPAPSAPARAQTLVDPERVAPQYREAAEKRRTEQIKQRDCAMKANIDRVTLRDRAAYVNRCVEEQSPKQ